MLNSLILSNIIFAAPGIYLGSQSSMNQNDISETQGLMDPCVVPQLQDPEYQQKSHFIGPNGAIYIGNVSSCAYKFLGCAADNPRLNGILTASQRQTAQRMRFLANQDDVCKDQTPEEETVLIGPKSGLYLGRMNKIHFIGRSDDNQPRFGVPGQFLGQNGGIYHAERLPGPIRFLGCASLQPLTNYLSFPQIQAARRLSLIRQEQQGQLKFECNQCPESQSNPFILVGPAGGLFMAKQGQLNYVGTAQIDGDFKDVKEDGVSDSGCDQITRRGCFGPEGWARHWGIGRYNGRPWNFGGYRDDMLW